MVVSERVRIAMLIVSLIVVITTAWAWAAAQWGAGG